jgi:hypothetical protein
LEEINKELADLEGLKSKVEKYVLNFMEIKKLIFLMDYLMMMTKTMKDIMNTFFMV